MLKCRNSDKYLAHAGSLAYPGGTKGARAPRGSMAKTVKSACFG